MKIVNDKCISIDLLEVVSNMLISKEQKEELVLRSLEVTKDQVTIDWEGERIKAVRFNQPINYMELTMTIDKNGEVKIDGN